MANFLEGDTSLTRVFLYVFTAEAAAASSF